jgi:putative FmdB family regulatory protein
MPIYEFRCNDCERIFETFVRAAGDGVACPRCGGAHLSRELSVFAARTAASNGRALAAEASGPRSTSGGGCCGGSCGCR